MLLNMIIFPVLDIHWSWQSIDLTGVKYLAANENKMINEVSACFKTSRVHCGPVDCTQYHLFLPCISQNSRLIVVDERIEQKNYCIKVTLSTQMILL